MLFFSISGYVESTMVTRDEPGRYTHDVGTVQNLSEFLMCVLFKTDDEHLRTSNTEESAKLSVGYYIATRTYDVQRTLFARVRTHTQKNADNKKKGGTHPYKDSNFSAKDSPTKYLRNYGK